MRRNAVSLHTDRSRSAPLLTSAVAGRRVTSKAEPKVVICYGELAGQLPYQAWCAAHADVPALTLEIIAEDLGVPSHRVANWLGLSSRAMSRKVRLRRNLSVSESERVLALARIIGQLASTDASSDAQALEAVLRWLGSWFERPVPALAGLPPSAFMDTAEGRQLVSLTVTQILVGSYA